MSELAARVRRSYDAKTASGSEGVEAFAVDRTLGKLRAPADRANVPAAVLESCDYYYENVLEQDWDNVQVFRVAAEGVPTLATVVTSDGGDGWLEVCDEAGDLLGSARTDCGVVLWRPREEIRRRVTEGLTLEPEFVVAREWRLQKQVQNCLCAEWQDSRHRSSQAALGAPRLPVTPRTAPCRGGGTGTMPSASDAPRLPARP